MIRPAARRSFIGPAVACLVLGAGYCVQKWREEPFRSAPPPTPAAAASPTPTPSRPAARVVPAPKRVGGLPFELTESSRRTGVVNTHELFVPAASLAHIAPWMTHVGMGAGVAVADFDGDGWQDVYLLNSAVGSRNKLFRNNHDGTFKDVAERAGVAAVNREAGSVRAIFADFDNSGRKDLLITTTYCPLFLRNNGDGTFKDATAGSGLDYCGHTAAANVIDYDNDGRLDVVLAAYYKPVDLRNPQTMSFMPMNWNASPNGGPIIVYHNDGNGTFSRAPGNLGIKSRGWTLALGVYDLRGTGRPDLYFATDFGLDQVYFNEGGGRFSDGSGGLGGTYSRHGMNAEAADLDNDGSAAVFVTHIYHPGRVMDQNVLWKVDSEGHFRNVSVERGVDRCAWSWGAQFVDLDNSGRLDLVVANGMLSATPNTDFWNFAQAFDRSANGMFGPLTLFEDARKWPNLGKSSMAGYQKKCVYLNKGDRFQDITDQTELAADRSDGRGLAQIDYLNNGSRGLVEANVGQPARFYANTQHNANHWLGLELVGTRSNRDSFGAQATLTLKGGATMTRQLQTANGYQSQNDSRLHFGLGSEPVIEKLRLRWPSGAELTLAGNALKLDRYHRFVEPK